jgi:hypothetical protein
MSLREALAKRRAAEPEEVLCAFLKSRFSVHEPPPLTIKICQWQSRSWVLPWSRFDDACFSAEADHDELVISFSTHRVTAIGANLAKLLDEISRFNIERLRNLPPEYRARMDARAPYLQTIDVRPLFPSPDAGGVGEFVRNSALLRCARTGEATTLAAPSNKNAIR